MRAKQFINEIERIGPIQPGNTIRIPRNITANGIIRSAKKLPGDNPYKYSIQKDGEDITVYMIDSGEVSNEIIGKLNLESIPFPLKGAVYVDYITVHKHYTGVGIAKSMYGIVLSILKRPLVAGSMQTPGGRKNWVSLNKIPGVKVIGYISVNDYSIDNMTEAKWDKMSDAIMNTGAQYIGVDQYKTHYFGFEVESDKKANELQSVYKNIVDLYTDQHPDLISTGMYAVWTGG
jgi:hypothetical protein